MAHRRLASLACLAPALLAPALGAAEPAWLSDLEAARKIAAKEKKPLLVYFTGSTWCGPCKALHAEVLPSPEFAAFAKRHVLVMLDYPPFSERSDEKVKANPGLARLVALKDQYKVPGFPTMLVLSPAGGELARKTGYGKGTGAAAYLADLR